jgi:hypothetical protein
MYRGFLDSSFTFIYRNTAWQEKADTFSHFSSPFIYKLAHFNVPQISGIRGEGSRSHQSLHVSRGCKRYLLSLARSIADYYTSYYYTRAMR